MLLEYFIIWTYQVIEPMSGWCQIRPYESDVWKFLRATFRCPYLMLSGTMEESSLQRILGDHITFVHAIDCQVWVHSFFIDVLEIDRSDIDVLYQSADRPNIYTQLRPSKEAVDIMYKFLKHKSSLSFHLRNLKNKLGFLVPVFCD